MGSSDMLWSRAWLSGLGLDCQTTSPLLLLASVEEVLKDTSLGIPSEVWQVM